MNPMFHIRKQVFGLSQTEMAEIAAVSQGTVSKWENGSLTPDRNEMERIRTEALRRGLSWDDSWFFEAPAEAAE
jgi:transcriptional regulator with XRE-family HTH domain